MCEFKEQLRTHTQTYRDTDTQTHTPRLMLHQRRKRQGERKISEDWDFPGGPVVNTSPSRARGTSSVPGWGAEIPHASGPKNQNM